MCSVLAFLLAEMKARGTESESRVGELGLYEYERAPVGSQINLERSGRLEKDTHQHSKDGSTAYPSLASFCASS